MKLFHHLKTITKHKYYVTTLCFRFGLIKQGLLHDLSKYSITELKTGAKYWSGTRSPNSLERQEKGYCTAWLHHKGRNKHHWEYWVDFTSNGVTAAPMPLNYVVEMFCDRVGATMVYRGKDFNNQAPLDYYNKTHHYYVINEVTDSQIKEMLTYLSTHTLDETIKHIKKTYDYKH
ncbi:MAG: DUF5662 family protein [Thomasclavelia sp.]|nr:DUF5662 family protein [Thomasclavelia sp.]